MLGTHMASTHDIVELMDDPMFKTLVAEIMEVVAASQQRPGGSANLACDALIFAAAIIAEADPHHAGLKGLTVARKNITGDASVMLKVLREHAERSGQSLLFSMTSQPTLN